MNKSIVKIAINKSIKHWLENLDKAYKEELKRSDIQADKCALCKIETELDCRNCILDKYGMWCRSDDSPWGSVKKLLHLKESNEIIHERISRLRIVPWIEKSISEKDLSVRNLKLSDYHREIIESAENMLMALFLVKAITEYRR
jgi:hypothetical protein